MTSEKQLYLDQFFGDIFAPCSESADKVEAATDEPSCHVNPIKEIVNAYVNVNAQYEYET